MTIIINDYTIRIDQDQEPGQELTQRREETVENLGIRILVSESKLKYKDIAHKMGITPEWLSRLMRKDLEPEMREKILQAVSELRGEADDQ